MASPTNVHGCTFVGFEFLDSPSGEIIRAEALIPDVLRLRFLRRNEGY